MNHNSNKNISLCCRACQRSVVAGLVGCGRLALFYYSGNFLQHELILQTAAQELRPAQQCGVRLCWSCRPGYRVRFPSPSRSIRRNSFSACCAAFSLKCFQGQLFLHTLCQNNLVLLSQNIDNCFHLVLPRVASSVKLPSTMEYMDCTVSFKLFQLSTSSKTASSQLAGCSRQDK